ncbi:C4-dicarboxylate-specific signal transduction histidine kinase [Paraburkholderia sp. Clong3]|uniref:ATP-binding protein n=1 Tax=Paraburkholderia sp. Clong3 TaxID=2991061 RepID=UPI003D1E2292
MPFIEGNRIELQQVLLHLVINAIEAISGASDGAREVLVSTEKADAGCVLVAVCDSGPGFSPESAERLFAPFYTTKSTGLGMGLSISRSIIEAHGSAGRVRACRQSSAIPMAWFACVFHLPLGDAVSQ